MSLVRLGQEFPQHMRLNEPLRFFSNIFRDSVAYLLRPRLRAPTLGSKWTACCLTGLVGDYRAHPSQSGKAMVESVFLHLMESAPNFPGSNRKAYS